MSFVDSFLGKMKLDDEDDGYMFEEDEVEEDEDEDEVPVVKERRQSVLRKPRKQREVYQEQDDDEEEERPARSQKQERPVRNARPARTNIVSMKTASKNGAMEVCLIKPTSVEDGREICDTLRSGRSVVVNLEGIPTDVAQRIIDFISGACYCMDGNLQPISNYIVIVTPGSVDLTGDFNGMVSADGINVSYVNN